MTKFCDICMTTPEKQIFMGCFQCSKEICASCFKQLKTLKCPFCKYTYNEISSPHYELVEIIEYVPIYIPVPMLQQQKRVVQMKRRRSIRRNT